jgi:hypothetical protein
MEVLMGNKAMATVPVSAERFMEVLKLRKSSIRRLGEEYEQIQRTERTIRRYIQKGEMPKDLLDRIAKYLDVTPEYLSGVYDKDAGKIKNDVMRHRSKSKIKPEKHPYLLKAKRDLGYAAYFENILTMNDISMKHFKALPAKERVLFHQEMIAAIVGVIARHFSHDSLGNDMGDVLWYCESHIGDEEPLSPFHKMEGIGVSEEEVIKAMDAYYDEHGHDDDNEFIFDTEPYRKKNLKDKNGK